MNDLEIVYKALKLLSNGLAIPVLLLSLIVIIVWFYPAKETIRNFGKSPEHWFILGVFLGFVGEFFDNLYWTIAWTFHYLDHAKTSLLMNFGVFSNIPFRQLLGIIAAYCHIRSALEYKSLRSIKKENNMLFKFNIFIAIIILLGVVFSSILYFIKH